MRVCGRRVGWIAAVLCLVAAAPGAMGAVPTSSARNQPARAQVGFWTGQNTTSCNNSDPTTCPRDLSYFTPAVWRALQRGHGALYFDLTYTVDFGPGAVRKDALPI